jgi:hypothetical protein
MQVSNLLIKSALFAALVPGVLLRLPKDGSFKQQALVHSAVFAILNYFIYMYFTRFQEWFLNPDSRVIPPCPPEYEHCGSGDCRLKTDVHSPCNDYKIEL